MKRGKIVAVLALAAAGVAVWQGRAEVAHAAQCLPWSEARPIINERSLIGSEQAAELAQARFEGEVLVNVKFCREGDQFIYLVFLLRTDTNALRRVVVDAVTGSL